MTSWFYTVSPPAETPGAVGQRTAEEYARVMARLLPPGRLWRLDALATLVAAFRAAGDELERVSGRVLDLLSEGDPRTATAAELLPDFERVLGLDGSGTEAERQAKVVARLTQDRGFRPADVAETLAPLLDLAIADVDVIERTTADQVVIDYPREIYRYFVYRDPALSGTADIDAAQTQLELMEHSHTKGHVIESIDFECDDPFSLCDRDLLGA